MKPDKNTAVCRGLRLNRALLDRLEKSAREAGFKTPSAFMRAAIEHELSGRESAMDETERRIAASLDKVARELRSVRLRQQAEFAFLDALVKTMLTHLTEIPKDTYD